MSEHKRYSSAEELLEEHIRDMGDQLGRVYHALRNEVVWAHINWKIYRQLFAKSRARVDLLNRAAGHFFNVIQRTLSDDVMLRIARMTDPETMRGRENLTIRRLPALLPEELRPEIEKLNTKAMTACDTVRPLRNKRLAHTDLAAAITGTGVPGVSVQQIDDALASLCAVLNRTELHFWKSATQYAETIMPFGGADNIVFHLSRSVRAEELRYQRLREGKALAEDYKNEEIP